MPFLCAMPPSSSPERRRARGEIEACRWSGRTAASESSAGGVRRTTTTTRRQHGRAASWARRASERDRVRERRACGLRGPVSIVGQCPIARGLTAPLGSNSRLLASRLHPDAALAHESLWRDSGTRRPGQACAQAMRACSGPGCQALSLCWPPATAWPDGTSCSHRSSMRQDRQGRHARRELL